MGGAAGGQARGHQVSVGLASSAPVAICLGAVVSACCVQAGLRHVCATQQGTRLLRSLSCAAWPVCRRRMPVHVKLPALVKSNVSTAVPNWLCRWGSTLSTKMFVAKDFVLKHIKGKHSAKLAEARQQVSWTWLVSEELQWCCLCMFTGLLPCSHKPSALHASFASAWQPGGPSSTCGWSGSKSAVLYNS